MRTCFQSWATCSFWGRTATKRDGLRGPPKVPVTPKSCRNSKMCSLLGDRNTDSKARPRADRHDLPRVALDGVEDCGVGPNYSCFGTIQMCFCFVWRALLMAPALGDFFAEPAFTRGVLPGFLAHAFRLVCTVPQIGRRTEKGMSRSGGGVLRSVCAGFPD